MLAGGPRDLPARRRTLRATLEWSLDLLTELERRDLARLSVFAGGWSLEAAEAVCESTLDPLSSAAGAVPSRKRPSRRVSRGSSEITASARSPRQTLKRACRGSLRYDETRR